MIDHRVRSNSRTRLAVPELQGKRMQFPYGQALIEPWRESPEQWKSLHKLLHWIQQQYSDSNLQSKFNADLLDGQHGPHYETRVNGETISNPDLNDALPAATSGKVNVVWKKDADGNVSAEVPVAGDVSGPAGGTTACNLICWLDDTGKAIQTTGIPSANVVTAAANITNAQIVVGSGGAKGVAEGGATIAQVIAAADRMNEAPTQVQATVLGTPWEYTLDPTIRFLNVLSDEGGQGVTVFLPTTPAAGQAFFIRNSRDSTENVEVSGAPGGHRIDGSSSPFVLVPGESVLLKFGAVDDWGVW